MTAGAGAVSRPVPARPGRWPAAGRLLRLELLNNAMLWLLPVAAALFWLTTYHKAMAMPPLWNMRARALQSGALLAFASPVAGAAAWMGSREGRRHTTDLVTVTARPRWVRQLATWAATTCWAMVGYLGCVAVLYGVTARQATWGGPLWWPAAVAAASLPALSALGFAAGAAVPSRFTAPLATVAAFFVLGLSTQLIQGSQSYWQVSPLVAAPWDIGPDAGVATFYPYLPDLPIAQVMFLAGITVAVLSALALPAGPGGRWLRRPAAAVTAAGLLAAGTAVALAGTGRLDAHGMIAIPALHDAASDRPVRYTPVCSHTPNPGLPEPRLCRVPAGHGGRPRAGAHRGGRPARRAGPDQPGRGDVSAGTRQLGRCRPGWPVHRRPPAGVPPAPARPAARAGHDRRRAGHRAAVKRRARHRGRRHRWRPRRIAGAAGGHSGADDGGRPANGPPPGIPPPGNGPGMPPPGPAPGSPAFAAARRFAALPASTRHTWLVRHLAALRAGRITLAQLP